MRPQRIVFSSLEALQRQFQVLLHKRSYHSYDDLQKVKGWVVRLILRKKHRGTCLMEGFKTRQPSRKFQHLVVSSKAHRGGTVRHCLSIRGHNHVDHMGEADTSPCFLSRGSSRLLRQLPFCLLFLFVYLLFPTLVLILLAFVSHCVTSFSRCPSSSRREGAAASRNFCNLF